MKYPPDLPYYALAIEAPQFSLAKHRQYVAARRKQEWAAKVGEANLDQADAKQMKELTEPVASTAYPFIDNAKFVFERHMGKGMAMKMQEKFTDADKEKSLVRSNPWQIETWASLGFGLFTIYQLAVYFSSPSDEAYIALGASRPQDAQTS